MAGAQKFGIEKTREKMVGRGVLLDIPRILGMECLPDGFAVTNELLDKAERHFGPQFSDPNVAFNTPGGFGTLTSASVNPRLLQFSLKYLF